MSLRIPTPLIVIVFLFITVSCNGVPQEQTFTKHGRVYKIGDAKPFTGTVTGCAREGYRRQKMKYAKRYKNGIRHGDTKYWYPNGKLESIEPYSNGKVNGVMTQYYDTGHIKTRLHLVNNLRGGLKGEQFWREDEIVPKDFSKRFFKKTASP